MSYTVYRIVCAASGKAYIGYTRKGMHARFEQHLCNARWKRRSRLYSAVRHHGESAFTVEMLAVCANHSEACEQERRLIAELGTLMPGGYNMTHGGDGVPMAPDVREAASAKMRGRSSPARKEAAERRRGVKASEATRAKLSAQRKGRAHSPERTAKRVERNRTPEAREAARQRTLAQWAARRAREAGVE